MPQKYETAREEHLPVPDNRLDWLVAGYFYDRDINDEVTLRVISETLRNHCGEGSFMTYQKPGCSHETYILFEPDNSTARDIVDSAFHHVENFGPLDEGLYIDILNDRIMAEWDSAPFSTRLCFLMDADEQLSLQLAFDEVPPDDVMELLEHVVIENQ